MALPDARKPAATTSGGANTGTGMNRMYGGFPVWVWALLGAIVVAVIAAAMMSGGKPKKQPQDVSQKIQGSDSTTNAYAPHSTDQNQGVPNQNGAQGSANQQAGAANVAADLTNNSNANPTNPQSTTTAPMRVYKDSITGVEMIDTPQGPIPTSTQAGQQYVAQNQKLMQQATTATAPTQTQQMQQALDAANEQTKKLDEKINEENQQVQDLRKLVKLQQESIISMSRQIQSIQPIVESQRHLAGPSSVAIKAKQSSKSTKVVEVQAIQGNLAWVVDGNGNIATVKVGDRIPATNLVVRDVDASNNVVLATSK